MLLFLKAKSFAEQQKSKNYKSPLTDISNSTPLQNSSLQDAQPAHHVLVLPMSRKQQTGKIKGVAASLANKELDIKLLGNMRYQSERMRMFLKRVPVDAPYFDHYMSIMEGLFFNTKKDEVTKRFAVFAKQAVQVFAKAQIDWQTIFSKYTEISDAAWLMEIKANEEKEARQKESEEAAERLKTIAKDTVNSMTDEEWQVLNSPDLQPEQQVSEYVDDEKEPPEKISKPALESEASSDNEDREHVEQVAYSASAFGGSEETALKDASLTLEDVFYASQTPGKRAYDPSKVKVEKESR